MANKKNYPPDMFSRMGEYPIQVIASFNAQGDLLPLHLRVCGTTFEVLSAMRTNLDTQSFARKCDLFSCSVACDGFEREMKLNFYREYSVWTVPMAYLSMIPRGEF